MTGRDITRHAVLMVIGLLIVYDIAIYSTSGVDATISRVTLSWSSDIPIVLIGIGVLIGHLFWPQPSKKKE